MARRVAPAGMPPTAAPAAASPSPSPTKKKTVTKYRLPAKPDGIKGWGRRRVGVGVPVVEEEEAPIDTADALFRIKNERARAKVEPPKEVRKGWGRAKAALAKQREQAKLDGPGVRLPARTVDKEEVKEEKVNGHDVWDLRAGEGFEEALNVGQGTGVDGVDVKHWFGETEDKLGVKKEFMGMDTFAIERKAPKFLLLMPRLYLASIDDASYTDLPTYRERGITHFLILGDHWKHQFNKSVQLRIPSQNIDSYNLYTHLEKIMTFLERGRELGKVLIVDNNGKSEGLAVFTAFLMRIGFTLTDAERIMARRVPSGRITYGHTSQLQAFEKLPHVSHQRISQEALFDIFPELIPPKDAVDDIGAYKEYKTSARHKNHPEPLRQLEDNAHLGYGTGGGVVGDVHPEVVAALNDQDFVAVLTEQRQPVPSMGAGSTTSSPTKAASTVKSPTASAGAGATAADSPDHKARRRSSVALTAAEDWQEFFDLNEMKMYYYNSLTGKTRWTKPKELIKLHAKQQYEADLAAGKVEGPVAPAAPEPLPLSADEFERRHSNATTARRYSRASIASAMSRASNKSKPSAYGGLAKGKAVKSASVARSQRSKMSAKQLAKRKANKHLLFKMFTQVSDFPVSPTSARISDISFRDGLVVATSDFDGNVKFSIWNTGVLLAFLQPSHGATTHATWCLGVERSHAYGAGTSDWVSVSYSGELQVWRDPVDTGAILTSGSDALPTLVQHIGSNVSFDDAPAASSLSHLCASSALRHDRVYLLAVTEEGNLLEYALPESEVVPPDLKVTPMPGLEGYALTCMYRGLHFLWDNSGGPMVIPMTHIAYTANNRYIITAAMDGSVRVWTHLFREVRAIPHIFEYKRFLEVADEPRPFWPYGAVTAMDISSDSSVVLVGYLRGGLVVLWEIDTGRPRLKFIINPEAAQGQTQADRVKEAQKQAKASAKAREEAKRKFRAQADPATIRSQSAAFIGGDASTVGGMEDATTQFGGSASGQSRSIVLGEDGRPIDDPNSRTNAAYSQLSISDSEEEDGGGSSAFAPSTTLTLAQIMERNAQAAKATKEMERSMGLLEERLPPATGTIISGDYSNLDAVTAEAVEAANTAPGSRRASVAPPSRRASLTGPAELAATGTLTTAGAGAGVSSSADGTPDTTARPKGDREPTSPDRKTAERLRARRRAKQKAEMANDPETGKWFSVTAVRLSHDNKFLVVATSHGWVQLYNIRSGRLVCQKQADEEISCMAISHTDEYVACGLTDGRVIVWEIQEGSVLGGKSLCRIA